MVNSEKTQQLSSVDNNFSKLHDCVIGYIFSFLPIDDILRTSILSKRWKSFWTSIPDIVFDETKYKLRSNMRISFFHSIETILDLHSAPCIRKFSLILKDDSIGPFRVNSWVSTAISRKVQELDLSLDFSIVLPDSLFTSESLNILKLNFGFKVPLSIQLPNLKTLHIRVRDNLSAQLLEKLFSSCPVIQELTLHIDRLNNSEKITISSPTLKTLLVVCRDSSLRELEDFVMTIYAEKLSYLKFINCAIMKVLPCNLSSLHYAYIDEQTSIHGVKEIMVQHAINLLGGIHYVKFLTLSNDILEYLSYEENLQVYLPEFRCLTHLKVIWGEPDYTNHQVLNTILQKSPNVESLEIPQVVI
ncbi:hypothetical protein Patl1_33606 [Pistacia atlantica]|uniref:Uncharacterized protein n=1 Tax=Pistacia atlantica TaxID=434234 RepID=A0ACC0ZWT9_9ROSI|nr:hypothetical protein Patl1_33606 [Pistacia atlantica]